MTTILSYLCLAPLLVAFLLGVWAMLNDYSHGNGHSRDPDA